MIRGTNSNLKGVQVFSRRGIFAKRKGAEKMGTYHIGRGIDIDIRLRFKRGTLLRREKIVIKRELAYTCIRRKKGTCRFKATLSEEGRAWAYFLDKKWHIFRCDKNV